MACLDEGSKFCVQTAANYYANCTDLSRKVKRQVVLFCFLIDLVSSKVVKSEDDWLLRYVVCEPSLKLLIFDIPTKAPEIISESFLRDVIIRAQKLLSSSLFDLPSAPQREALPLQKRVEKAQGAGGGCLWFMVLFF
jgi:hypothetical protein